MAKTNQRFDSLHNYLRQDTDTYFRPIKSNIDFITETLYSRVR